MIVKVLKWDGKCMVLGSIDTIQGQIQDFLIGGSNLQRGV